MENKEEEKSAKNGMKGRYALLSLIKNEKGDLMKNLRLKTLIASVIASGLLADPQPSMFSMDNPLYESWFKKALERAVSLWDSVEDLKDVAQVNTSSQLRDMVRDRFIANLGQCCWCVKQITGLLVEEDATYLIHVMQKIHTDYEPMFSYFEPDQLRYIESLFGTITKSLQERSIAINTAP